MVIIYYKFISSLAIENSKPNPKITSMKKAHVIRKIFILLAFFMYCNLTMGQAIAVKGTVKDASNGSAIPGVTIVIKGTQKGTTSDLDGKYSIQTETNSVLVFSFVGYETQEIPVNGRSTIDVTLNVSSETLEEVIVIGYGSVKKTDLTGSVTSVSSKDFNKGAITSPQELLVGKTAGVVITTSGGAPGTGATIRIRGGSSVNASNDPLVVIDGVPVANDGISGVRNPLSTINPNDIETFTVLKDASATAIYGSRASNGVILITTKKGGKEFKISYNGNTSVNSIYKYSDVFSAKEYRALINDRYASNANALAKLGNANTDWQKEIFGTAIGMDHNISVSGTNFSLPYRASVGYTNQDGILKTTNMKRTTLSIGLSPTLMDDHIKLNVNAKGMNIDNNFGNDGAIGSAIAFDPTQPVHVTNAYGNYFAWLNNAGNPLQNAPSNPVALLQLTDNTANAKRILGNIEVDYKFHFMPDLHLNINMGYDQSKTDGKYFVPANASWGFSNGGTKRIYDQQKKTELFDSYLAYSKDLSEISSKLDITAGYSYQHYWKTGNTDETNADGTVQRASTPYKTENFLVSFFGRVNYSLMDKYLLTFSLRDDGSSRFADHWGLFPSAAFAWKINEESFLKNVSAISDLKLRLGYGKTGQQDIGQDYPFLAAYNTGFSNAQYQFGSNWYYTIRPEGYDANIKWEETTTYNVGLDFGFMNNKITGMVDVYSRKTNDLLNTIPVSAGTNFTNQLLTNVGNLTNKGIELSLNARPVVQKDLFWEVGFNFSYNINEVTKLTKTDDPTYLGIFTGGISGAVGNTIQIISLNNPMNSFFVLQQVYDTHGNPIEGVYVDKSGLGASIPWDDNRKKFEYEKAAPDFVFGLSSRLNYKNWDFSFTARANVGNYVYNNRNAANAYYNNLYWSEGYLNNIPKNVNDSKFSTVQFYSNYYVENASFLKLDNLSVGYSFKNLFKNGTNIHLSGTVQNLLTITKYSGLDPEVDGGIDNNIYPRPRIFIVGLSIDL